MTSCPKPTFKRVKDKANPIPKKLLIEVMMRDDGICQKCFCIGSPPHHIAYGGMGRKRVHKIENLITLCLSCHEKAHSENKEREWTYQWSRARYGTVIDELLKAKWGY